MKSAWTTIRIFVFALITISNLPRSHASAQPLYIVSYGGSYARACDRGYHERFEAETGIKTNLEDFTGRWAQIRAQVENENMYWDVEVSTPCPSQ